MLLRNFLLAALLLLPSGALAIEPVEAVPSCPGRFSQLMGKIPNFGAKISVAEREKAVRELESLYQKSVKDIFPEIQEVKTGRRTVEKRVRTNAQDKIRFKAHFDALWEKRIAAGQVPKWELDDYRTWLKTQGDSEGAYPPIAAKTLLDDYVTDNGTISEYFDFKYLEYLEKVKFVRPDGTTSREQVEAYLKTLDPNVAKHYAKAAVVGTKNWAKTWIGGAAIASLFLTLPNDLIVQPIKAYLIRETKEQVNQVTEKVLNWTLFDGGEKEYEIALAKLRGISVNFDGLIAGKDVNFDTMPRVEGLKQLESYLASTSAELPRFHALVLSEQKDFETIWDKRLADTKESVVSVNASYTQFKIALRQLEATIASRGGQETPEEAEVRAEYAFEMDKAEDYIANILADWQFYKQVRGKNKIDAAIDRNFATIYEKYMRTMSVGRLASAINTRVKAHVEQLEAYSDKTKKKKEAEPGTTTPLKPEEQIRVENPAVNPDGKIAIPAGAREKL